MAARSDTARAPDVAIVLGSGLGEFTDALRRRGVMPYGDDAELAGVRGRSGMPGSWSSGRSPASASPR